MEAFIKEAHPGIRVGEDAKAAMAAHLVAVGRKVAEKSSSLALHAGRRTVQAEDVALALSSVTQKD